VTAVEPNPLIVQAAGSAYQKNGVTVQNEAGRSFMRRSREQFDLILLSLGSSYHPVRSGAYSLAEDYRYTLEGFQDAYNRLEADGLLVASRWLQTPPSEELRLFALAVSAVENLGGDPLQQIVALRGYNTATLLVRKSPFTPDELDAIREFASTRAFDLIYAPDILAEETNRYNRLSKSLYYIEFVALHCPFDILREVIVLFYPFAQPGKLVYLGIA
jgi:spermidine synthase